MDMGVTTETARRPWVDNLRVVVIAGVIVLHSVTAYLGGADWYYMERAPEGWWTTVVAFPALAGAMFGLAPLFLVAGWFSAGSVARHGPRAFVRVRAIRLGLPLVAYVLVVDPLASSVGRRGMGLPSRPWAYGLRGLEAGPMWFVAALLVFSVAYAVLRRVRPAVAFSTRPGGRHVVAAVVVLAGTSLLLWQWWPMTDSTAVLNLRWGLWPQGAVLFALGALAAETTPGEGRGRHDGPEQLTDSAARRWGWLAMASLVLVFALAGIDIALGRIDLLGSGQSWEAAVLAVLYGVVSVVWSLWLMAWARRHLPWRTGLLSAAGRAAYATYVMHPLVLTAIMALMAAVAMPAEVKFLLVSAIGVPVCYAVGLALVRTPGLSRFL